MEFTDLVKLDKGVTFLLAMIVIYFIIMMIRHIPKWVEIFAKILQDNAVSTDNNTEAMRDVKKVIRNTEEMHTKMDIKIATIENTIKEMKSILASIADSTNSTKEQLICKIEKLEKEIKSLKERRGLDD